MHQIIAIVIALVIGVCGTLLVVYIRDLNARLKKLEKANQLRVPFKTQDQLLDVMALLDTLIDRKEFEAEIVETTKRHEDKLMREARDRLIKALTVGTNREEK